jgi:hypothetical protein
MPNDQFFTEVLTEEKFLGLDESALLTEFFNEMKAIIAEGEPPFTDTVFPVAKAEGFVMMIQHM